MSGFVASARVERVRPHLTRIDRDRLVAARTARADVDAAEGIVIVERARAGSSQGATLTERWQDLRERWAETTFYLFDADSWR